MTRAQAYLSTALSFGVVALVFALVDQLLLAVLPLWGEQSIVALYGEGYGPGLLGFAWTLAFNLAIVFLSYALAVLHGRVGKAPFLLGLLAFGLLAFVLVPTVFQVVPGAADAAGAVLLPALGFTAQGIVLANPIVLFAVVAVLSALAAYLLTRRAEVRCLWGYVPLPDPPRRAGNAAANGARRCGNLLPPRPSFHTTAPYHGADVQAFGA